MSASARRILTPRRNVSSRVRPRIAPSTIGHILRASSISSTARRKSGSSLPGTSRILLMHPFINAVRIESCSAGRTEFQPPMGSLRPWSTRACVRRWLYCAIVSFGDRLGPIAFRCCCSRA